LAVLSKTKVRRPDNKSKVLMGLLMNELRGRIDGRVVAERVDSMSPEIQP
jgi:Glu-tRNA(Gln) amidotransferase subunit E-like FAD-binding protein